MNFYAAPPKVSRTSSREPLKTPREKEADGYGAALAAVLSRGLAAALDAGDQARAVAFINRGFAEGSPQLGCDLLCQAISIVGPGRTWTVQIAPLSQNGQKAMIAD